MFNKLLEDKGFQKIYAGIGLGCDKKLIIKAGQSGSGINEMIRYGLEKQLLMLVILEIQQIGMAYQLLR